MINDFEVFVRFNIFGVYLESKGIFIYGFFIDG